MKGTLLTLVPQTCQFFTLPPRNALENDQLQRQQNAERRFAVCTSIEPVDLYLHRCIKNFRTSTIEYHHRTGCRLGIYGV